MTDTLSVFTGSAVVPLTLPLVLRANGRAIDTTAFAGSAVCPASQWQRRGTALAKSLGYGSLTHRADTPWPAARSCWAASRAFVATQHHHFRLIGGRSRSHAVKACRPYLTPASQSQCCATWQSERRGAGCGSRLASHRGWLPSSTAVGALQLGQSYITPHCPQCPPVSR